MQTFELELREIATGLRFPEGPVVLPDGAVAVVEIESGNIVRVELDGRKSLIAHVGGGPNGAALGPDGKLYVCNNGGFAWIYADDGFIRPHGIPEDYVGGSIQRVDLASGAVETLYTHCGEVQIRGPNDIVFDADGGFWFTDYGKHYDRLMERGCIYYARTDGSLIKEAAFPLITPNGIGLSPDGKTLYAPETEAGKVWAWPVLGPGELGKEAWPAVTGGRFLNHIRGYQRYDSMAVEAGGNVCVATMGYGEPGPGISVYSPAGELIEFHKGPEFYVTNLAFGGEDMRTAYITLSGYGRLVAAEWPRPGLKLAF
jgi:gluconolactonase